MRYAEVVLELQSHDRNSSLTYAVPPEIMERLQIRQVVWVPLRDKLQLGVVARLHDHPPPFPVRPITALLEPPFVYSAEQWALAEWLMAETLCTFWQALALFLPPRLTQRIEYVLRRTGQEEPAKLSPIQRQLLRLLTERGPLTLAQARRALGRSLTTVVERLVAAGSIEQVPVIRPVRSVSYQRAVKLRASNLMTLPTPARQACEAIARWHSEHDGAWLPWSLLPRLGIASRLAHELVQQGLLEVTELPRIALITHSGAVDRPVQLTTEQQKAWEHLSSTFNDPAPRPVLLHGVTGSGKTELYLRAIAECLRRGRQALVLVPEIALATQVVQRIASRFPGRTVLLHSAQREAERIASWETIHQGWADVVVGPRSALFGPLRNIGLIVMDEEHDAAYKQQEPPPRYHARAVAQRLAKLHHALLLLGSATPDIVTMYQVTVGNFQLIRLSERVGPMVLGRDGQPARAPVRLPLVRVVDMRLAHQLGNPGLFSQELVRAMEEALRAKEQILLLLNRRGHATLVQCRACGHVEICPFCDIPLVFHADQRQLLCHRCGFHRFPRPLCPNCNGSTLGYYGAGTQRVEREVRQRFPDARILRWDQDALRQGKNPRQLLHAVLRQEVDIIVGTQMVAKGFDFPALTVVGIIHADTGIYLPDFRAAERTFQLLTQVAGRAGRHLPRGQVVIQTYTPEHYAIRAASRQDYDLFYREELAFRERHGYPPFRRLVRLILRHRESEAGRLAAAEVAERLREKARELAAHDCEVLGPTPAFVTRIRGWYQWQLLVRGADGPRVVASLPFHSGWIVDIDPVNLL